jgi:methoxymalonate biosynthesis protein
VIKCLVWDLDRTLLAGVYLESPDQPPPADPAMAAILADLAGRGILQAIASRNPPEAARHAEHVTGHPFAAVRCGWGAKSAAISSIIDELGLAAESVAFVDDDSLERAEVSYALPEILVLGPIDMAEAATWPQFSPRVVTDEARRRGELYRQRRERRTEAQAFGGSRDDFLRYCQTHVTIFPADHADVPRLHELSVRTHQFNSAGTLVSEEELARLIECADDLVIAVRLSDRFGDDGLVGGCVIGRTASNWQVPLVMMSCRAMGRGVIDALLAWLCHAAHGAGAAEVMLPCLISPRNVPLRIALTGAGFRAREDAGSAAAASNAGDPTARPAGRTAVYVRQLGSPLPALPSWARAKNEAQ